jgi:hypothetical protein
MTTTRVESRAKRIARSFGDIGILLRCDIRIQVLTMRLMLLTQVPGTFGTYHAIPPLSKRGYGAKKEGAKRAKGSISCPTGSLMQEITQLTPAEQRRIRDQVDPRQKDVTPPEL